jgi:uncharacterized protein YdeI (YjbR/CyaY-like superfamily)
MTAELLELVLRDANAWRRWLDQHHAQTDGVWLVLAKKGTTKSTGLTYEHALEEALCYGWIDGQAGRRDQGTYKQRFTPRRRRSRWSKRNVDRAERLLAEGRMHPAGVAEMERAKVDGRWEDAYGGPAEIEAPPQLVEALAFNPKARAMFQNLSSQNRYAILYRLKTAKRADTAARRLDQFVAMLERGETIYPQKR